MDPFTLTDSAGTIVFDGTQAVFTPANGGSAVTLAPVGVAPAVDPVVSGTVVTASGVVYNGTFTAA